MSPQELFSQYMPGDNAIRGIADFFEVFSQETRIRILVVLSVTELNVNDIAKYLNLNQSTVSHQLRILKDRRIVISLRKGKEIYYSIANGYISEILFSAVKATEDNETPLSEKVSQKRNSDNNGFVNSN
jgi:ArsR family transcriptional regulator